MILGPSDGPVTMNKELSTISAILEETLNERGGLDSTLSSDGFLEYLYGIVLLKGKCDGAAKLWLLKSIHQYAWNWSAWHELADNVGSVEEVCCHVLVTLAILSLTCPIARSDVSAH